MHGPVRMIVGCPRFEYVELARGAGGRWQLRWLGTKASDRPQFRTLSAASLEVAEHEAERFLGVEGLFTAPQPPPPVSCPAGDHRHDRPRRRNDPRRSDQFPRGRG